MIFSFLVATKSLFPHVATRDIRIVKGSNDITTHWSRSRKSYLISESEECTFPNHVLIVINQLPNNHFHISNVACPINWRNQFNYNQDHIVASLRCYLYAYCHYVVLITMLTSNAQAVLWHCLKLSITAINKNFCDVFIVQLFHWCRAPWPNNWSIRSSYNGTSSTKCGRLRYWPPISLHRESWQDIFINHQENTFQTVYV